MTTIQQNILGSDTTFATINKIEDSTMIRRDFSPSCSSLNNTATTVTTSIKHTLEASATSNNSERPAKRIRSVSTSTAPTGCRRVTCKARGLSKAHKAENAFIEIPNDAPHGLIVSCSHPECGGSGRKFRFCKVCALPVAKRNFLKRHGHGLVFTAQQLKENVDAVYCRVIPSDEPIIEESASSNAITDNEASDAPSVGSEESTAGAEDIVLTVDHVPHQQQHPLMVSFEGKKQLHFPTTVVDENTPASVVSDVSVGPIDGSFTELSNDEKQWLSLFRQRPCVEEQSLTHWMDKVLTVASDNTTTVAPPQTALTAPPSLIAPISPFQQPTVASSIKIEQPYTVPLDIEIDPLLIAEQEEESALITAPSSPALSFTSEPVVERNNVPLVEPGMRISEENFAAAVMGIDFSLIFE